MGEETCERTTKTRNRKKWEREGERERDYREGGTNGRGEKGELIKTK